VVRVQKRPAGGALVREFTNPRSGPVTRTLHYTENQGPDCERSGHVAPPSVVVHDVDIRENEQIKIR